MRWIFFLLMTASTVVGDIVPDVRSAVDANQFPLAEDMLARHRAQHGVTPEMVEAMSWLGRGALATKHYDQAVAYAKRTEAEVQAMLKTRPLDKEPHLPIALGAAIEVEAQVLNARSGRAEAVTFLRKELALYRATSIRARIQKNINLLDLVGKPAPALEAKEFLGPKPPTLASLKGHPVLLFFWAHWCPDCKLERKDLADIRHEFGPKGLVLINPTQRYGYVARGEEATPAQELPYIDQVWHKYYGDFLDVPTPVSEEDFRLYGASTVPTLVLIDKQGVVRMFHPGKMTAEELRAAIHHVL